MKHPGERLREWRTRQNLTQQALAELVGVNQGTISRLETGDTEPDLPLAIELAKLARSRRSRLPVDMWAQRSVGT